MINNQEKEQRIFQRWGKWLEDFFLYNFEYYENFGALSFIISNL